MKLIEYNSKNKSEYVLFCNDSQIWISKVLSDTEYIDISTASRYNNNNCKLVILKNRGPFSFDMCSTETLIFELTEEEIMEHIIKEVI